MTDVEASKLVAVLLAAFPHARVRDERALSIAYEGMLVDLDLDEATAAVHELLAVSRYLPTIAEIREQVGRRHAPPLDAGAAWGLVLAEVRRVGIYGEPTFVDRAVAHAVAMMGWAEICNSENQIADRAHFFKVYAWAAESVARYRVVQLGAGAPRKQLGGGS